MRKERIILTDVDGVLLEWENHFERWMLTKGHQQKVGKEKVYSMDKRYGLTKKKKEELIKNNLEVILYPNPADEYINIRFNSPVSNLKDFQILYLSVDGIVVKSSSATMYELLDGFQEDISSLKPGFYVVSLLSGGFVFTLKLLKK